MLLALSALCAENLGRYMIQADQEIKLLKEFRKERKKKPLSLARYI